MTDISPGGRTVLRIPNQNRCRKPALLVRNQPSFPHRNRIAFGAFDLISKVSVLLRSGLYRYMTAASVMSAMF